jgi:hypothetical protein
MKKSLFVIAALFVLNVQAEDFFTVPSIQFNAKATNAMSKLEDTLKYPESLLKRYKPAGATISNKRVSGNNITFNATKSFAFISKTVVVHGVLDSIEDGGSCAKGETGFNITFNFDGSDALVTENIDRIEAKICAKEANNQVSGLIKSKIYIGTNYSSTFGPIAKGIIEAQINPLATALTEEIQVKK